MCTYRRSVKAEPAGDGTCDITQSVEYRLAVPLVGWLLALPARHALARIGPQDHPPWWGPPDVLDTKAWAVVGSLLALATVVGYLGTLLSQTVTYSAREFHVGPRAEGIALAVARADVIVSLGLVALADRRGRRVVALGGAAVGCVLTALGALAPSLAVLAGTQVVARGFVTAAMIASSVLIAETMPKGARAWAVGVTAMAAAVGAGVCVISLPLAGLGIGGWRLLYAASLLWLILVAVISRHLVESERFTRHRAAADCERSAPVSVTRSRLLVLLAANFCLQIFVTPASEFQNEYLRSQHHFSPSRISIFTLVTVLPGAFGIVVGGRLADTAGRRRVAITAVAGVTVFGVIAFSAGGWTMWAAATVAAISGAAVTPALAVYGPELFTTARRGAANGLLTAAGRLGAIIGLLIVGVLSQWLNRFGPAFAVLAIGPAALVALIFFKLPETAHRSLEDLNPSDAPLP